MVSHDGSVATCAPTNPHRRGPSARLSWWSRSAGCHAPSIETSSSWGAWTSHGRPTAKGDLLQALHAARSLNRPFSSSLNRRRPTESVDVRFRPLKLIPMQHENGLRYMQRLPSQRLHRPRPQRLACAARDTSPSPTEYRRAAAALFVEKYVKSGVSLGLGSGELSNLVIAEVGSRLASGKLQSITAVPSCNAAASSAAFHGVPLRTLEQVKRVRNCCSVWLFFLSYVNGCILGSRWILLLSKSI